MWAALVFCALSVGVVAIRRSWFGRQLTALRDSELTAATLGMGVRRAKVAIFAVSGFIAGCAGALFGGISGAVGGTSRSEEHTSELQSLMRISYAVFCLKNTKYNTHNHNHIQHR